ncbi:MAG: hypothetical protein GEEBNDBF_01107 [bacterium]|nr:hypothetical protein [bacterium]
MDARPFGLLAADPFGPRMAGPARRSLAIAQQLAAAGVPIEGWYDGDSPPPSPLITWHPFDLAALQARAGHYVGILLPAQAALREQSVFDLPCPRVIDCTAPFPLETAALLQGHPADEVRQVTKLQAWAMARAVSAGDYWLASNEAQEAWLLGLLTLLGRVSPSLHTDWGSHDRVLWCPYGISPLEALPDPAPRITLLDRLGLPATTPYLLWSGGLWPWMDPLLVIQAMPTIWEEQPALHLLLPGLDSPHAAGPEAAMADAARELVASAALQDRVHLLDWIPAADWPAVAEGAILHISAHRPSPEATCSHRTRYLEAVRHSRRLVVSGEDPLGRQLELQGVAAVALPGDPEGFAGAVLATLEEVAAGEIPPWSVLQQYYSWETSCEALVASLAAGLTLHPDGPWSSALTALPDQAPPVPGLLQRVWNRLRR